MRAHLSPACIESILAMGHDLTVKQFQRLLRLVAAASNVIPSVHETPTVVVETQGVFLERESVLYDRGHAQMPLRTLSIWKRPWFLSQSPVL